MFSLSCFVVDVGPARQRGRVPLWAGRHRLGPFQSAVHPCPAGLFSRGIAHRALALAAAIDEERGPARFYLVLMSAFSAIAAFLAAIGLYGVVSQAVTQRRREIAIRLALGAGAARVMRQILGEGLRTVGFGIVVGLALTALGARLLDSLLFQVKALDPTAIVMGILGMLTVALLALLVPAFRAGRADGVSYQFRNLPASCRRRTSSRDH